MTYPKDFDDALPVKLELSTLESERFGLPIARLQVMGQSDADLILELFQQSPAELLILRYPTSDILLGARLQRSYITILHADTLVYFCKPLDRPYVSSSFDDSTASSSALNQVNNYQNLQGSIDQISLKQFIMSSFEGYSNHYRANPLFQAALCLEGYIEWALTTHERDPDSTISIHDYMGLPLAVAITRVSDGSGEFLLTSVAEDARGRGLLGQLMSAGESYFADKGATNAYISTQVWNHTAQRSWARSGYSLESSFNTIHILRDSARSRFISIDK